MVENSSSEQLFSGHSGRMLLALSTGWFAIQIGRQTLPPLLPTIIAELQITPFIGGVSLTMMWALYALCHYPGGRFSDQLSRRTVLVFGLFVLTIGFLTLVVGTSRLIFLVGLSLIGVGSGLYFITMRAHMSDLFVARRGQAFGIQAAAGNIGSILAGGVAVAVLALTVWNAAFVPVSVFMIVSLGMVHTWSEEPYTVTHVDFGIRHTLHRVFESPELRLLIVAYSAFVFTWQGVSGFLPTFLQSSKGFSTVLASGSFALMFAIGMLVMPISGSMSDRFARLPVALVALLLSLIGLGVLISSSSTPTSLLGICIFATGLMAYPPVMQAYLMDQFPMESRGGDFGAFKTIYSGIGSLGPAYVGFVANSHDYTLAYESLLVCLLGSLGIIGWLAHQHRRTS